MHVELSGNGDSDAVFDVLSVMVVEQHPLQSPMSSCHVVRRSCRWCPRGWISWPSAAAAHLVDGLRTTVGVEDSSKLQVSKPAAFNDSCVSDVFEEPWLGYGIDAYNLQLENKL